MGVFLYNIFIYPIEMLVEFIYVFFEKGFHNPGLSIAAISIVINIIALPLYNIANTLQKTERDARIKMQSGIQRIKDTFKGDEQYMMLSTFYRQNHYHPAYALRSSVSLLIQVPFFIAAYHFLSNLGQLQGQSFAFISDLGRPDGLLAIGGFTLNLLPLVMTAINIIAGVIYMKGFPLRDKVQLYSMAGLFLVLLYTSPAGLVLYWTLNNVFSVAKNIFYKFKNPLKVLYLITVMAILGLGVALWIYLPELKNSNRILLILGCVFIISLPLFLQLGNKIYNKYLFVFAEDSKQRCRIYLLSSVLLFLVCGVVVPLNLISSSTIEFAFTGSVNNPLAYVFNTASIFFGLWIVWGLLIYTLSNKKIKTMLSFLFCSLAIASLLNLFVFKGDYGTVNQYLRFDNEALLKTSYVQMIVPPLVIIIFIVGCLILLRKKKAHYISVAITILIFASLTNGVVTAFSVNKEFKAYEKNLAFVNDKGDASESIEPVFHLSQDKNNVIIIFLDRAISGYFPIIMEQFPELKDQFKGFVFYPNTVSFGLNTVLGAPSMVAGYEYTPDAINIRSSEKLVDKHNEALLVLPRIFHDADYSVTITDPPFSNYEWAGDYSPFILYPDMRVVKHSGKFSEYYKNEFREVLNYRKELESNSIKRRLPIFSILKTTLPIVRRTIHEHGDYFLIGDRDVDGFINNYAQLYYLNSLTDFSATGNTYTFIGNDTTHTPTFLQAPQYEPRAATTDQSTPLDAIIGITENDQMHYHANAAAIKQLGRWFENLQAAGAYDNSRIVIVADHGRDIYSPHFENFEKNSRVYTYFNPLLVMKDFNAKGPLQENDAFMTNADAPLFVVQDLDVSTINPFTQNDLFENLNKNSVNVYNGGTDIRKKSETMFRLNYSLSFSVHDSIFIESNWNSLE